MGVYLRGNRWMVFCHDEKRKRHDKSFGAGDAAQQKAEEFDAAVKQARKDGWNPSFAELLATLVKVDAAPTDPKRITFEELCEAYLNDRIISGTAEEKLRGLKAIIKNTYFAYLDKDKPAADFTYLGDIAPFLKAMCSPKPDGKLRAQGTINRYGDYLAAIFNFGERVGLITNNPVKGRRKAKEVPREVKLTVADIEKIMDAAEPHIRWAIEVCFNLGTRSGASELLALKWENVDFEKAQVRIFAIKTKTYRTVPVSESFLQRLKEQFRVAETDHLIEYKGRPIKNIAKGFRSACKAAGIPYHARMYDLRHMYASTMLASGADLKAVSLLMGHADVTMTANTYYQYIPGEKEKAVSKLPCLSSRKPDIKIRRAAQ